jgi:hypothetical protein
MRLRKYWREAYLTAMMLLSYAIIIAAGITLRALPGLLVTAAGVFVAVIGVGLYDQWTESRAEKVRVRTRR